MTYICTYCGAINSSMSAICHNCRGVKFIYPNIASNTIIPETPCQHYPDKVELDDGVHSPKCKFCGKFIKVQWVLKDD